MRTCSYFILYSGSYFISYYSLFKEPHLKVSLMYHYRTHYLRCTYSSSTLVILLFFIHLISHTPHSHIHSHTPSPTSSILIIFHSFPIRCHTTASILIISLQHLTISLMLKHILIISLTLTLTLSHSHHHTHLHIHSLTLTYFFNPHFLSLSLS